MSLRKVIRQCLGIEKRFNSLKAKQKSLERRLGKLHDLYISQSNSLVADPLIVPRLSGGLGNQLFQISTAYAIARRAGATLALNYDWHLQTGQQGNHPVKYKDSLYRNIRETSQWPTQLYEYFEHVYRPIVAAKPLTLEGYFQSGKYFEEFRGEVRDLFAIPEDKLVEARDFLSRDKRKPVGIHMRLGDYRSARYKDSLHVCTPYYYRRALRRFPKERYRILLCSDSPEEGLADLGSPDIEVFRGSDEVADMVLLSQCSNLIISNSTFSWWSSFLGVEKAVVIAPSRWFGGEDAPPDHDMYEPDWLKVRTGRFPFS